MPLFLRQIARYAAQKLASDPRTREKASKITRAAVNQAKEIASDDDKARAVGRAFRRAIKGVQGDK